MDISYRMLCCIISTQVGLAVCNGQLLAIGGFDGQAYLKSVEVLDPGAGGSFTAAPVDVTMCMRENTLTPSGWRVHSSMMYRRLGGGVGVLKLWPSPTGGFAHSQPRLDA